MQVIHKHSTSPLVISIPHSGTDIPHDIAPLCNLASKREHTDWALTELVASLLETTLVATISRYIVDVNRFKPRNGKATQPIIPRIDEKGNPLFYNYPSKQKQADWLERYYTPYYHTLERLLQQKLEQHSKVLTGISNERKKSTLFCHNFSYHSIESSGLHTTTISCFSN